MKLKKILSFLLLFLFVFFETTPVMAIDVQNNNKKLTKKQKKELAQKETRIGYVNLEWWQGFNDEYLNEYILKAIENNYDLKLATLKVEEARQNVKIQFASELPSITAGASPAIVKIPGETSTSGNFMVPVIASYEIDIFLKNHDKTKSAKKLYEASQLNEKAAYIAIASAVGATYYNIVKADKLIELQKNIVSDRKMIFDLMKLRNNEGITSTSDMVKAEKAYILADSNLTDLEKARSTLLTTLAVLTGDSPENIGEYKRISYDKLMVEKVIPNEIPSDVITQRPDYLVAEKMIEKAGIDVRVAKKEFLPTFNIGGMLTMLTMQNVMSWETALAGAGIIGILPIFTGGKRIAYLKIQKNRYEQMLQEYHKTNINAIKEVNDALKDMKYDDIKYQKGLAALEKEQVDFKFAQQKLDEGIISQLDLIQQNEVLLNTKVLVVSEKINNYIDQISLYKVTAANL